MVTGMDAAEALAGSGIAPPLDDVIDARHRRCHQAGDGEHRGVNQPRSPLRVTGNNKVTGVLLVFALPSATLNVLLFAVAAALTAPAR